MPARSRTFGFACLLASLHLLACATGPPTPVAHEATRDLYGVSVRIIVRHPDGSLARTASNEGFRAAEAVASKLLAGRAGSEIDLIGKVPPRLWVEIAPETHAALALAAHIAEDSDGAYDYTWPALRRSWGLHEGGTPHQPRDFEIDMALRRVDWEDIEIRDDDGLQARRLNRRTEIDLGGVARGAMVDAATTRLRELGLAAARVSTTHEHAFFGGNVEHPWRIDVGIAVVTLAEGALAVVVPGSPVTTPAGDTIEAPFDPRSGRPTRGMRGVAVRTRSAAACAGYASAIFAMAGDGPGFIDARSELDAVIAREEAPVWVSATLAPHVTSR